MKTIAEIHDQDLLYATLLKAVFPLSEEFQCSLSGEIYITNTLDNYINWLIKKNEGSLPQI